MRSWTLVAGLLLLIGCGRQEPQTQASPPETPFGTTAEVGEYLQLINPYVQEIGHLQAAVEQVLGSSVGSSTRRMGTGRNLAEAATAVQPRLQKILVEFDGFEPPPLLAPFHRDTKKLILLRLEAYRLLMNGWEAEESGADFQAQYDSAEARLNEANEMIGSLNAQMAQINQTLQAVTTAASEPVAR